MYYGQLPILKTYVGECEIGASYYGQCLLSGGDSGPELIFSGIAPDQSNIIQGVLVGTQGLTDARVADIELPDYQGVYKTFGDADLPYEGGIVTGDVNSRVVAVDGNDQWWLVHAPEATNHIFPNRDLSGQILNVATVSNAVGIDGVSRPIQVNQSGNVSYILFRNKFGLANPFIGGFVKWVSGIKGTCRIYCNRPAWVDFNIETLEITAEQQADNPFFVAYPNGWYLIGCRVLSGAANRELRFYPCLTAEISSVIFDAAYVYPSNYPIPGIKTLPPIYTYGSPVTRDATELVFNPANHSDTGTKYELEVILPEGDGNILGDFLYWNNTTGNLELRDGTNTVSVATTAGQHSVQIDYDATAGTMGLSVDGGTAVTGSYDGTLLTGAFDVGRNNPHVVKIREIKRYE